MKKGRTKKVEMQQLNFSSLKLQNKKYLEEFSRYEVE